MSLWRILAYNVIIRYQNYHILLHKFSNFSFSFKVPLWGQKKSTFQNSTFSFLRWYKSAQKFQNMKKIEEVLSPRAPYNAFVSLCTVDL